MSTRPAGRLDCALVASRSEDRAALGLYLPRRSGTTTSVAFLWARIKVLEAKS